MTDLKHDLRGALASWRKASKEADLASADVSKPFAQGYLRGLALAYDTATQHLEAIINANRPKVRPAALKAAHRVLHVKRQLVRVA